MSMPTDYSVTIEVLESQKKAQLDEVRAKLRNQFKEFKSMYQTVNGEHASETAMVSKNFSHRKSFKCFRCGKMVHLKKDCLVWMWSTNKHRSADSERNSESKGN